MAEVAPLPAPAPTLFVPFRWRPSAEIPARQWLYGKHYIRKYLSATVGGGAAGKSTYSIAEALAMVTGRPLLGVAPDEVCRVAMWNGEDPGDEVERRINAAMHHHGVSDADLGGRLMVGWGRKMPLKLAHMGPHGPVINETERERVLAQLRAGRVDVLIIDPLVKSHGVAENENGAMDLVASAWTQIADEANCAVEVVHHPRKTGGGEVVVEDARGAIALIQASRSARVLNVMSEGEALKAGVDRRRSYVSVANGKANLAPPPEGAAWFHLEGVRLENGDSVAVAEVWEWPNHLKGVTAADLLAVQQRVDAGQYRESAQAAEWVGKPVAEILKLDVARTEDKAKIKGLLRTWLQTGALEVVKVKDEKGNERPIVRVGKWVELT